MGTNANQTSVVIPGERRASGVREGDLGIDMLALYRLLGSLPLARLTPRSAGNDSFEIVSMLQGGISL